MATRQGNARQDRPTRHGKAGRLGSSVRYAGKAVCARQGNAGRLAKEGRAPRQVVAGQST
jgi:hypothetical protein